MASRGQSREEIQPCRACTNSFCLTLSLYLSPTDAVFRNWGFLPDSKRPPVFARGLTDWSHNGRLPSYPYRCCHGRRGHSDVTVLPSTSCLTGTGRGLWPYWGRRYGTRWGRTCLGGRLRLVGEIHQTESRLDNRQGVRVMMQDEWYHCRKQTGISDTVDGRTITKETRIVRVVRVVIRTETFKLPFRWNLVKGAAAAQHETEDQACYMGEEPRNFRM